MVTARRPFHRLVLWSRCGRRGPAAIQGVCDVVERGGDRRPHELQGSNDDEDDEGEDDGVLNRPLPALGARCPLPQRIYSLLYRDDSPGDELVHGLSSSAMLAMSPAPVALSIE